MAKTVTTGKKSPNMRDRQRNDTFQRIYKVALEEFSRVGVDKARVSEICVRAGVAKGTFFFHFPTKDHVLLERQRDISEAMSQRVETELEQTTSASEFISGLTRIVLEEHQAVEDLNLVRHINLALVRALGDPEIPYVTRPIFSRALITQITRLQKGGAISPDIEPEKLVDTLRLCFFGFLLNPLTSFEASRPLIELLSTTLGKGLKAD